MSIISELQVTAVRNIDHAALQCHPHLNIVYGHNGSGKTSLLEAIYLLARGKSFRTASTDTVIGKQHQESVVHARLVDHQLGVSRNRGDKRKLQLDDRPQSNWDDVARVLPVLILDSGSFSLLDGGPGARRQYLDWGVFHVEQTFLPAWRRYRRALANRNQLLKHPRLDEQELAAWDGELDSAAAIIDHCRSAYIASLKPVLLDVFAYIAGAAAEDCSVEYQRGWSEDSSLADVLLRNRVLDTRYKSTQAGPQRADLAIKIGNKPAAEVLSRGQQKMLVSALKIAQGKAYTRALGRECIYLVDDLPAELDTHNRGQVLEGLGSLGSQLFVTSVEARAIQSASEALKDYSAFHVERGKITPG